MDIVQPPYILDFGKAYLDEPPPYADDPLIMDETHAKWRELFGDRWLEVAGVVSALTTYGIYYADAKPSNIRFAGDEDDDEEGDV